MNSKTSLILALCFAHAWAARALPGLERLSIADDGWRLWPDAKAAWREDPLYLPDEINLAALPVNPPTGGWQMLNEHQGVSVTLPSTVEQHYWGKFGFRPYDKGEYFWAGSDSAVRNGNYEGVSWWWRELAVPASFKGKVVLLHVRGARQRTEVYVNHRLAGYDLIAETEFTCDVSAALRPGERNQLALRITNPGGRMDWVDFELQAWGRYRFQKSHGFGGLDRALTLEAHDPVFVEDAWVLNTPAVRTVTAYAKVVNLTGERRTGTLQFAVFDPRGDPTGVKTQVPFDLPAQGSQELAAPLTFPGAELWDLSTPRLYEMRASLATSPAEGQTMRDEARRPFGFRWFAPEGVGDRAGLFLNGKRIRLYTAISWGFWGLNGLWPTPELATKEVRAAKQLGLNMLNFHRDIGKEEVLAEQDRLGLLRYMEPGGGVTALPVVEPPGSAQRHPAAHPRTYPLEPSPEDDFARKYEEIKILRMVRQFRSHPSLVIYVVQNELEPQATAANPRPSLRKWRERLLPLALALLQKMHAEDPSRVVALSSGIAPDHEVWIPPYGTTILRDDGTGYSGWRDEHTVGGPGVWTDDLYRDPGHFTHRLDDPKEIVDWGEMLGSPSPDHHGLMVDQIRSRGGESYDLKDHEEIAAAYERFLDRWGFRSAFPTTEALFSDAGRKAYEFWGRVDETARLSESNDILTMSGWETTAIENHSGVVDNLRNLKGDPALIRSKLAPLLPVVKPRGVVHRNGDAATLDLYLLNETDRPAPGRLRLDLTDPSGRRTELGTFPAPAYVRDRFVYPIRLGLVSPPLNQAGEYRLSFALEGETAAENGERVLVVQSVRPDALRARIGVLGDMSRVLPLWRGLPAIVAEPYRDGEAYDLLVAAPGPKPSAQALLSDQVIGGLRAGRPLLVFPAGSAGAEKMARELAAAGAFHYLGMVDAARAPWMGSWIFVRSHPLYEGLPTNEVMKGDYQIPSDNACGVLVDGRGVEIIAAYGRDHDRNIGAATFTARLGGGRIVFQCLSKMNPVLQERWMANALLYLLDRRR